MIIDNGGNTESQEQLDTKMTWRRRMGVRIFKDRGDVGPQKLYINPHLAPIHESHKHQRKFKRLFVDREINFGKVTAGASVGDSVLWVLSIDKDIDTSIRIALRPLLRIDLGNTEGIIKKYDFKNPVWFNMVHTTNGPSDLVNNLSGKSQPERFWQNCVMDWYEMRMYLEKRILSTGFAMGTIIDGGPFTAFEKIGRPQVKLFTDGPLLDEESEFAYLTELST